MAKDRTQGEDYLAPIRRLFVGALVVFLFALFLLWRIDSPRVERLRMQIIDATVPNMAWLSRPVTGLTNMMRDFQSYQRIVVQNQELRRELQQMKSWKEAALQLRQENARLLDLNNVQLDPRLTYVTGEVLADSGSPFRQSVLLNIGARDGLRDGWAAMDGIGLVGRISGLGDSTARVVLLTDTSSRIPVRIQPLGETALIMGDNSSAPPIDFVENPEKVRPGDRVISSGDGGVLPAGLLIGQVAQDPGGRLRVRLAADYERLKYLRVLRSKPAPEITDTGSLVIPEGATAPPNETPAEN